MEMAGVVTHTGANIIKVCDVCVGCGVGGGLREGELGSHSGKWRRRHPRRVSCGTAAPGVHSLAPCRPTLRRCFGPVRGAASVFPAAALAVCQ